MWTKGDEIANFHLCEKNMIVLSASKIIQSHSDGYNTYWLIFALVMFDHAIYGKSCSYERKIHTKFREVIHISNIAILTFFAINVGHISF